MTSKIAAWKDDKLEREKEAKFIKEYLIAIYEENIAEINNSFVLNLNSPWGYGKTYFLENLKLELEADRHPVIYFDAWKNDFSENALLGFIAEINLVLSGYKKETPKAPELFDNFLENGKLILKTVGGVGLNLLAKKLTGYGVEALKEQFGDQLNLESENVIEAVDKNTEKMIDTLISKSLEEHQDLKKIIDSFKLSLERITRALRDDAGYKLPMFILVDELDRCRPTYAIELLENIKHIFNANGVFFILATNKKELAHSISAVYGGSFDSFNYLKRFFNQEYKLTINSTSKFINQLFTKYKLNSQKWLIPFDPEANKNLNLAEYLFEKTAEGFGVGLRDMDQICIELKSILLTSKLNKIHYPYLISLLMYKNKNHDESSLIMDNFIDFKINFFKGDFHRKLEEGSFKSVIEFYKRTLAGDRGSIIKRINDEVLPEYQSAILHDLLSYYNSNNMPLMQIYRLMVDQAGHLN